MELILFSFFLSLSLIAVVIGIWRPEHTEFSMVGFLFIFMLSFTLLGNNLTYQTGQTDNAIYEYDVSGNLTAENHTITNVYSTYTGPSGNSFNSRFVGFWMAAVGVLGLLITFYNLRRSKEDDEA